MRVWFALAAAAAVVAVMTSCSTLNVGTFAGVSTTQKFVGRISPRTAAAVTEQTALMAFLVAPKDDGTLDVRAYLCDGQADGELAWVRGPALPQGNGVFTFSLTSASGFTITGELSQGTIVGEVVSTETRQFSTVRAPEGSGIFDLVVDAAGNINGTSLTGDTISLTKSSESLLTVGDGRPFVGQLTTVDGHVSTIEQMDLSTLDSAQLTGEGFSAALAGTGISAGTYRTIVIHDNDVITSFGRLLLPGTGVNGLPPQFGSPSAKFSSAFRNLRR